MPRKTLKQRRNPTDDQENRVRGVVRDLIGTEDADDIMTELISVLNEGGKSASVGKYYTFFYDAKTTGRSYDQHPLVGVTEVFSWGFRGINYHWGAYRNYGWGEVVGKFHPIDTMELKSMRSLPYANYLINN